MKYYLETLGCDKNTVDSEIIISRLKSKYSLTRSPQKANIIIINTCAFIDEAKQESIDTILHFVGMKGKKVIVVGCLGQRYGAEIIKEIPEVSAVVGVYSFRKIEKVIEKVLQSEKVVMLDNPVFPTDITYSGRELLSPSHYAYVKISDGCNRMCSFCIIPKLKGKLRSRAIDAIILETEELVKRGVKEIILVAQDITSYGIDNYGKRMLCQLIKKLIRIEGLKWLRLLYNYPDGITNKLLDLIANEPKVCRYLDVPIQHISDHILHRMKREINGRKIREMIMKIRENYPDIFLRTTVMVGFPGESEKDFVDLQSFVKEARFERLGVFTYSREYGTASYNFPGQIPERVKLKRKRQIMELQEGISLENNKQFIGKTISVIIDETMGGRYKYDGRTQYDTPEVDNGVLIKKGNASVGKIVPVKITDATCYDLIGEIE